MVPGTMEDAFIHPWIAKHAFSVVFKDGGCAADIGDFHTSKLGRFYNSKSLMLRGRVRGPLLVGIGVNLL